MSTPWRNAVVLVSRRVTPAPGGPQLGLGRIRFDCLLVFPVPLLYIDAMSIDQGAATEPIRALEAVRRWRPDLYERARHAANEALMPYLLEAHAHLAELRAELANDETLLAEAVGQATQTDAQPTPDPTPGPREDTQGNRANGDDPAAAERPESTRRSSRSAGANAAQAADRAAKIKARRDAVAALGITGPFDGVLGAREDPEGSKTALLNVMARDPDRVWTKGALAPALASAGVDETQIERLLQRMQNKGKKELPPRVVKVTGHRGGYRLAEKGASGMTR
jgi:hypothetical protein